MTYKVNDLVYFDTGKRKGVGKIVVDDGDVDVPYLVHSTQIIGGHDGYGYVEEQDNDNNLWFSEMSLKPFTKKEGQKYKVICNDYNAFEIGDIVTITNLYRDGISTYKNGDKERRIYDIDHPKCELEFYEDAEEHKENEMFTKDDLEVGYMVKTKSGRFAEVVFVRNEGISILYADRDGLSLRDYRDDLSYNGRAHDIEEVYGYAETWSDLARYGAGDRKLLWKRKEVKEMTLEDLQEHFGYEIKVVD